MNILIVLTSHGRFGTQSKKTGFWLEELATPYYLFKEAGAEITLASPLGGRPPMDPESDQPHERTSTGDRFKQDTEAQAALQNTARLGDIDAGDYDAVFYPGGHGPLWDLADNKSSIALIEALYAAGKPVAAVCHGPAVFRHTRGANDQPLVSGRRVTSFTDSEERAAGLADDVPFSVQQMLDDSGGRFSCAANWEAHTQVDGNLITGQNPASSPAVAKALLAQLQS